MTHTGELEGILERMKDDVDLIPDDLKDWWSRYLVDHTQRYLSTYDLLKNRDKEERTLEIGSIPGHFIALLKTLGHRTTGLDLDPDRVQAFWKKHDVEVLKVDVERERIPFDDTTFDTCLFLEIIEHLRIDPLHSLSEAYRVLKPEGLLILSTPNITPIHRIEFLFGRDYQGDPIKEFSKVSKMGHMGHFRLYSAKEVTGMLQHAGFVDISLHYQVKLDLGPRGRLIKAFHPNKKFFKKILLVLAHK